MRALPSLLSRGHHPPFRVAITGSYYPCRHSAGTLRTEAGCISAPVLSAHPALHGAASAEGAAEAGAANGVSQPAEATPELPSFPQQQRRPRLKITRHPEAGARPEAGASWHHTDVVAHLGTALKVPLCQEVVRGLVAARPVFTQNVNFVRAKGILGQGSNRPHSRDGVIRVEWSQQFPLQSHHRPFMCLILGNQLLYASVIQHTTHRLLLHPIFTTHSPTRAAAEHAVLITSASLS